MSECSEGQLWQFKFWVWDLLGQAGVLQVKQEHSEEVNEFGHSINCDLRWTLLGWAEGVRIMPICEKKNELKPWESSTDYRSHQSSKHCRGKYSSHGSESDAAKLWKMVEITVEKRSSACFSPQRCQQDRDPAGLLHPPPRTHSPRSQTRPNPLNLVVKEIDIGRAARKLTILKCRLINV